MCGHNNLEGVDVCDNCGADLRQADIPTQNPGDKADPAREVAVPDANEATTEEGG
jgi:hypothetical protein